MEPESMIVSVLAMFFTYSLLKQLIVRRNPSKREQKRSQQHEAPSEESFSELQGRIEELLRRIHTLEDIIASERHSEGS